MFIYKRGASSEQVHQRASHTNPKTDEKKTKITGLSLYTHRSRGCENSQDLSAKEITE